MSILTVMVKPMSGACNMRCSYCFYSDVMHHREQAVYPKMSLKALETLVKRALYYGREGVSFSFQGGEPTLAGTEFFEALVRYERMYNTAGVLVSNSVQSNGYDLPQDMIELFAREHFLLGISLDGDAQTHDRMRIDAAGKSTYSRIVGNIKRLQAAGVDFNILCVVNKYVAERPKEIFEALRKYKYLQFIPCLDGFDGEKQPYSLTAGDYLGFIKTTFDLYYQAYFDGAPVSVRNFDNYIAILLGQPPENCAMGGVCGQYFLVEADGSVYPCDFYVLDEWKLGNVQEQTFARLAKSEVGKRFRETSLEVPMRCRECRWYGLCRNGCKRERDPETGVNRNCECFKSFFEYAVPRMREIADDLNRH